MSKVTPDDPKTPFHDARNEEGEFAVDPKAVRDAKRKAAAEQKKRDNEEISWFLYHKSTEVTGPLHDEVRKNFRVLVNKLHKLLPPGADRTVAIRALQNAMWASNSAIANHDWESAE